MAPFSIQNKTHCLALRFASARLVMSLRSMIIEFALLYFLFNRSRDVDVFLPLDGELYKIQGPAIRSAGPS